MEPMNSMLTTVPPATGPLQQADFPVEEARESAGTVPLGGYALHIERIQDGHLLRLNGPGGEQALEIALTPEGPVLRFQGGMRMDLAGDLAVDARLVSLHGREGLVLTSGADATLVAEGDLNARARLGDLSVRANDDVRIDGERIRMNC